MIDFNDKYYKYVNNINPLAKWLNALLLSIEKSSDLKIGENLENSIKNIRTDLSHRSACLDFYNLVIKDYKYFLIKEKPLDDEKITYPDLRHQSAIALLVLNTRMYEKCVNLCYQLHLIKKPESQYNRKCYVREVLDLKRKNNFNKYTEEEYKDLLEKLKNKFGYYMEIISDFRNQFVHRFVDKKSGNIFLSDTEGDELNPEFLNKVYEEIKKKYITFQPSFSERDFYKIMENCTKHSDHHVGCLMYLVFRTVSRRDGVCF